MIGRDTACAAIVVNASAAFALRPPSDEISAPPSFFCARSSRRRRNPARLEDVSRPVEQADDADRRLRSADRRSGRPARGRPARTRAARRRSRVVARPPPPIFDSWKAAWTHRAVGGIVAVDGKRDVPLRRSLCDRDDVDLRRGERREDARGDPRRSRHAVADHGEHRHARLRRDVIDQAAGDLAAEHLLDALDGAVRLGFRQGEADRALGRRLEDRRHGEPLGFDRRERARGDPRGRPPCPCRRPSRSPARTIASAFTG